jgi:hypothetical protein
MPLICVLQQRHRLLIYHGNPTCTHVTLGKKGVTEIRTALDLGPSCAAPTEPLLRYLAP